MTDHTQQQTRQEQDLARELSLQSTRPPVDVPGYEAERLLGRGAYGEVWVGVDQKTGRRVAIKFLAHRRGIDWTLLSREVEKLVYLSADRYVVQLLDVGWDAEPPYYVMEYIEHGSLDDLLFARGPLSVAEAVEIFREVATGLLHAHGKGILHCDLKPANILLDQDHKPRLADFGQSRLSHEQSPSLGTLFYMAPEQADLTAVPDARWDVYALGAMLYTMLVGFPPYRTAANVERIETSADLPERLDRYQKVICNSPPPAEHRKVPRIDRGLCDIVDRCLAVDPEQRFANVQAVLDALHTRDVARVRKPLLFLGLVGPALLFIVMALFGIRGYEDALRESEQFITQRARESNDFAAKFAARSIEGEIARYFRMIRTEAAAEELHERLAAVAQSRILQQLNAPGVQAAEVQALRPTFVYDADRQRLHEYLENRLATYNDRLNEDPTELKLSSMFAVDRHGRMLASVHDEPGTVNRSVGWNFSYRTYFHGESVDKARSPAEWQNAGPPEVAPIDDTHFSAAFQSTTTGTWKVAITTPILKKNDPQGEVLGVLALTVNLGDFSYLRTNYRDDHFAVLIDGRPGPDKGVILQHPLLDQLATLDSGSAKQFRLSEETLATLASHPQSLYTDPMGAEPQGERFQGQWIPAIEWVHLPSGSEDKPEMLVLVQERYDSATEPVRVLDQQLKREGIWALIGAVAVVLVLWYVVLRALKEPVLPNRRRPGDHSSPTPPNYLTTLPGPQRPSPSGQD